MQLRLGNRLSLGCEAENFLPSLIEIRGIRDGRVMRRN